MNEQKTELILGLEIHLELKTDRKLFSYARGLAASERDVANADVDTVSLGLPGALPVLNLDAFKTAQRLSYALTGNLNENILFERKNYFYQDLPKGYQITCPHQPLSTGGEYDLGFYKEGFKIKLREIHVEEDTAKSIHEKDATYVDFNKSSLPLLEIVTEPDFRDVDLAVNFCKDIQRIARILGCSDADMDKGHMRLEANISVRKIGETDLPNYRVEIKNINSFGFMKKAVNYEIERQTKAILEGRESELVQETRGFNEVQNKTFTQRSKEDAHDYRYFADPDIPPIYCNEKWRNEIIENVKDVKLPNAIREELLKMDVAKNYVDTFIDGTVLAEKLYQLIDLKIDAKLAANTLINKKDLSELPAEEIVMKLAEKNNASDAIVTGELETLIKKVCDANSDVIEKIRGGQLSSIQFLVGQLMRETKGKANAAELKEKIEKYLEI